MSPRTNLSLTVFHIEKCPKCMSIQVWKVLFRSISIYRVQQITSLQFSSIFSNIYEIDPYTYQKSLLNYSKPVRFTVFIVFGLTLI